MKADWLGGFPIFGRWIGLAEPRKGWGDWVGYEGD